MYLPRALLATLYDQLKRTSHPLSAPVLVLVGLDPDALCACRILTHLLKRDYIQHKIQPIAGYADLERAGSQVVRPMRDSEGGAGGVVVCLGVGGLVDLSALLGFEDADDRRDFGGVEVWVIDARRPWNLNNVFGGESLPELGKQVTNVEGGRIGRGYVRGRGGIVVFDDGDIEEEMDKERAAYLALVDMPEVEDEVEDEEEDEEEDEDDGSDTDDAQDPPRLGQKRKSLSDPDDPDDSDIDIDNHRPRQRRRSNSVRRLDLS